MDQNIAVAVSIYRLNLRYQSWWSHHHPSDEYIYNNRTNTHFIGIFDLGENILMKLHITLHV